MLIDVVLAFMIIVSFLIAMILHEIGHSLVAAWMGDPTPRTEGRMSLSLAPHINPLGTLLCVILAFFPVGSSVGLGWGNPVKADPWKLRGGPNVGTLIVALGGIFTSLLLGGIFAGVLRILPVELYSNAFIVRVPQLIAVFAIVNISLAIFNLMPLYPLDGYQILYSLLPSRQAVSFAKSAPYGPFIILLLIFLLPFLGQLTGLSDFFLFRISFYILQGSLQLVGLISGAGGAGACAVYLGLAPLVPLLCG
ncbi:MAG TPA: site-2 protease family protein [Ktedonobacteraceae bacterium]|nr:site-2 protease family protein [Ktedonobacteraceae bacterium]